MNPRLNHQFAPTGRIPASKWTCHVSPGNRPSCVQRTPPGALARPCRWAQRSGVSSLLYFKFGSNNAPHAACVSLWANWLLRRWGARFGQRRQI